MIYKKILFVSLIFVFFNMNVFSQKDTTICFEIKSSENQIVRRSVLGIDLCNMIYYRLTPMLGINYERILSDNKTISLSGGSNIYLNNRFGDISTYGKFEYRFYFPDTGIPRTSSFNDNFYLQKKKKTLRTPEGMYVGIVAIYKKYKITTINSQTNEINQELINSCGIGGSLGYQFVIFNKIHTNISLPLVLGCKSVIKTKHLKSYEKKYPDFSFFIDMNFGIAF